MPQGVLPFHYERERTNRGMTAAAGLPLYLELAHVLGAERGWHAESRCPPRGIRRIGVLQVVSPSSSVTPCRAGGGFRSARIPRLLDDLAR